MQSDTKSLKNGRHNSRKRHFRWLIIVLGLGLAGVIAGAPPEARIGIVGLGVGSLACYAKPGQDWHFYEIDPMVAVGLCSWHGTESAAARGHSQ